MLFLFVCVKIAFYCVQIVRAVIEVMMLEQPLSSNVICTGYDKVNTFSFFYLYFEFMEFHYRHTEYNVCFFLFIVCIWQCNQSSPIVELLNSSAWCLLLERVC